MAEDISAPVPNLRVGGRPDPDPTVLTAAAVALATDTLRRELKAAVEILEAKIAGDLNQIKVRLDGNAEAVRLLQGWRENQTGEMDDKVGQLEKVIANRLATIDEKFSTVNQRFATVDKEFALGKEYTTQSAIDRKEELKTALSAAEKAVDKNAASFTSATDKSEKATGELLRQQAELLRSTKEGLDSQIGDLKVRLATAEANASAAREAAATASASAQVASAAATTQQHAETTSHQVDRSYSAYILFAVVSALIAVVALGVAILKP